ncbi:MAG: ABC transporter permease, partial [Nannocystaceae bacterium]
VAQSVLVGALAGLLGVALAVALASATDLVSARYIPDFPYKPETLFELHPLVFAGALLFSCGFCVLGALLPASRASKIDPVTVLTSH